MKLFATAVALTGAFAAQTNSTVGLHGAVPNGDFCSIIAGDLPSFCQCSNTAFGRRRYQTINEKRSRRLVRLRPPSIRCIVYKTSEGPRIQKKRVAGV
jgi:hypothetical protein